MQDSSSFARLVAATTPPGPPFTRVGKEVFNIRASGRCHFVGTRRRELFVVADYGTRRVPTTVV